ncbi:YheC/YheD family protein, partial [Candidatus Omnitrophota bacterium]
MKKTKRDISILALGDAVDYDSYQKLNHEKRSFLKYGFNYHTTGYRQFLDDKAPRIKTEKLIIFLFFPFSYWDKHIEHKDYRGIYGNRTFYKKFSDFWGKVERKVKKHYGDKKIFSINDLFLSAAYRDKITVVKELAKFNIPQPKLHKASGVKNIFHKLESGHRFFLKPRYGSMGKGITYLSLYEWETNFNFRNNRIISRISDHGWKFRDITGNQKFLRQLLSKDIFIQGAVDSPIIHGNKLDFRVYTFLNKAIYVYPRRNSIDKVTTNISQGGCGDPRLLKLLPKKLIDNAKREAERVSRSLNINLGGIDIIPDRNL